MNMFAKICVFGFCLILDGCVSFSQTEGAGKKTRVAADYTDFNLIFHQDFEKTPVGPYEKRRWQKDWNKPSWAHGIYSGDRAIILESNIGTRNTRCMEWNFPEGTYSTNKFHGYNWRPKFKPLEEAYLSYSIMFKPGFETVKGGKLPGVQGGSKSKGPPEWDQGFGGSLMFKPGKRGVRPVFYTYHQDMPEGLTVGETVSWGEFEFDVATEIWYDITYRIVMNTATATDNNGPDGLNDAILEGYVNGKLFGQRTGLRLRNLADIGIDMLRMQGFFGGGTDSWKTIRDEWIRIDNVYIWTYSDKYLDNNPEVKQSHQPNNLGDIIYTPLDVLLGE